MNKINHFFKFLLNGGSAIILTIIAFMFFSLDISFGMSVIQYTCFISYTVVIYLGIQILQFNLAKVSTVNDAIIDFGTSAVPFLYILYVLFTKNFEQMGLNEHQIELEYFVRNILILTVLVDIVFIGWSSLKMLLFTDKNAHSG